MRFFCIDTHDRRTREYLYSFYKAFKTVKDAKDYCEKEIAYEYQLNDELTRTHEF